MIAIKISEAQFGYTSTGMQGQKGVWKAERKLSVSRVLGEGHSQQAFNKIIRPVKTHRWAEYQTTVSE